MTERLVAATLVLLVLAVGYGLADTIHIVEIGDSITQGRGAEPQTQSWRYPFWKHMVDSGLDFDMIGTIDTGFNGDPDWPDYQGIPFDRDHEGHWGWTSWGILGNFPYWLDNYEAVPDCAMFLLGTNGSGEPDAIEHNVQCHRDMINLLREKNPAVVILLGLPFQEWNPFPAMRTAYTALAADMTTEQSPVVPVDNSPGWVSNPNAPGTDTVDWVHPNTQGDQKVADHFYDAFQTIFPRPEVPGDVTGDRLVNGDDIETIHDAIGGPYDPELDLNGDDAVDQADVDYLIHDILNTEYGDITLDGVIDAADLSLMAANWQFCVRHWGDGDVSLDGCVNAADLSLLASYWQSQGPAGATVPAPPAVLLGAASLAALLTRRNR